MWPLGKMVDLFRKAVPLNFLIGENDINYFVLNRGPCRILSTLKHKTIRFSKNVKNKNVRILN